MPTDLAERILAALGYLVLRYKGAGLFAIAGVIPAWTTRVPRIPIAGDTHVLQLIETFPFLEAALANVDQLWLSARNAANELGEWAEIDNDGHELHLKATLLLVAEQRLMLISVVDDRTVELLRRARRMTLEPSS